MKNPITIVVFVVVLAAVGYFLYANNKTQSITKTSSTEDSSMNETSESMDTDHANDSKYVIYSPMVFEEKAVGRRVLFFYANWCPTCRPADESFRENQSQIPGDLTVIRINYNDTETDEDEKALAQKYGITYQHTFVQIDSAGNQVTKWNGGQIDELLSNIQ